LIEPNHHPRWQASQGSSRPKGRKEPGDQGDGGIAAWCESFPTTGRSPHLGR